jgi:hypothetical protein
VAAQLVVGTAKRHLGKHASFSRPPKLSKRPIFWATTIGVMGLMLAIVVVFTIKKAPDPPTRPPPWWFVEDKGVVTNRRFQNVD